MILSFFHFFYMLKGASVGTIFGNCSFHDTSGSRNYVLALSITYFSILLSFYSNLITWVKMGCQLVTKPLGTP